MILFTSYNDFVMKFFKNEISVEQNRTDTN